MVVSNGLESLPITVNIPSYDQVGVYKYTIREDGENTAGVTYTDSFTVAKEVTGNMANRNDEFEITVTENQDKEKINGYTYVSTKIGEGNFTSLTIADDTASAIVVTNEKITEVNTGINMDLNPDVCAWVMVDNTNIDYPVLQGSTNLTYINRDVYGNFALAGSIFLDSRNERDFSDAYSLLYGHHMENSGMFGDLDLYKEQKSLWKKESDRKGGRWICVQH